MMITLTIQDVPPSLNKALRMHWRDRQAMYNDWMKYIRAARIPPEGLVHEQRQVKIILYHSRRYDKDNAYGAVKPIVDALNYWNYIYDDNEAWIDLTVEQGKCRHSERHTIIDITA